MENTYNGWKNYETWNVALYLSNEREFYEMVKRYIKRNRRKSYTGFLEKYGYRLGTKTPDGVSWHSSKVCRTEITEMFKEWWQWH